MRRGWERESGEGGEVKMKGRKKKERRGEVERRKEEEESQGTVEGSRREPKRVVCVCVS